MVRKISIKNFKSIQQLDFELGRFNVFIGANGSGKSNVLEAIAFGGAAAAEKLDNEFLVSRGIRVSAPKFMFAGFSAQARDAKIIVQFNFNDIEDNLEFSISQTEDNFNVWKLNFASPGAMEKIQLKIDQWRQEVDQINESLIEIISKKEVAERDGDKKIVGFLDEKVKNISVRHAQLQDEVKNFQKRSIDDIVALSKNKIPIISSFLIYSPTFVALRNFYSENQIVPLGIHGEGLFKLLKVFGQDTENNPLQELTGHLQLIDWFEDLEIEKGSFETERFLKIKDQYLDEQFAYFDQRSANEGFLFLLFYLALFISEDTPSFFAIDNIETALNPKLCAKLLTILNELSIKHGKQVIFTTHNPSILDGLNLHDDEQRLFVVERNVLGHTKINRITSKSANGKANVKLSEAFMKGYLGGLPDNF